MTQSTHSTDSHVHHTAFNSAHRNTNSHARQHAFVHQDFHWVEGDEQGSPYANFLETVLDITAGIHTCLQIAYASDLEREANDDTDDGEAVAPAVGIVESDQLVRMSIATAGLLRDEARRRVQVLNDE